MKWISYILLPLLSPIFLISCKKFVEVSVPPTELASQNVFTSDASATAAMVGTYSMMMSSIGFASGGVRSITQLTGLTADEFVNFNTDPLAEAFYKNELTATNSYVDVSLWNEGYKYIYNANAIINGLMNSTGMTDSTKNQLEGEAKFVRAFCHFYLVNLFGDVPLITATDYKTNSLASRTPSSLVYAQIITDLKDAASLLSVDYRYSGGERIRPNKWAATAMLARVYLYTGDWQDAETQATLVIENTTLYNLNTDLNTVFLKNSNEAIWQLMPVQPGYNTQEGETFILTGAPQNTALNPVLLAAFEAGDQRRINWIDSITINGQDFYFPFKYKIQTGWSLSEYSMVLRLAEQYLVRAEAELELNDLPSAEADLNVIRNRAALPNTTANTKTDLMSALMHERQMELFSEWGQRWLDLKRNNLSDQILGPLKSPGWQSTDTLYPIPKVEITNDPNLTQNPGY
ncbi:MAG TPA: RagB/SusD family nutrient uptake outer membrane protein [Puia sp.]|nr:RagB/SusD family nutrient uptake outer membrane protein [Puia sp.]